MTPILGLGYARPLEPPDLYKLEDDRSAKYIADKIVASFERRRKAAEDYNARLVSGEVGAGWRKVWWAVKGNRDHLERKWREVDGRRKASLVLAMNDAVKWWFWSSGLLRVIGDTAQVTSPLVVKVCTYQSPLPAFDRTSHRLSSSSPPNLTTLGSPGPQHRPLGKASAWRYASL